MRPKSLLLLALALGCGLVASIGISQVMESKGQGNGAAFETAPIYVALHNINLGDPIDASMISLQDWPKDKIPQGALTQLADVEGRRPRTAIIAGEPILDAKLMAPGELADPIGLITKGMRLITISVDAEKSAAGLLSPGDRVDIQLFVNRNPSQGFESARSKVILQNIRVYAVDQTVQRAADGEEARSIAKTVSLLLTPEQANKVSLAQQVGEISLIPRSPNDEETVNVTETTIEDLLGDNSAKNTRAMEQNRKESEAKRAAASKEGMLAGIMQAMQRTATERPPFTMEVIQAEDIEVLRFDPYSGKRLDHAPKRTETPAVPAVPTTPSNSNTINSPASASDAAMPQFPIDFSKP